MKAGTALDPMTALSGVHTQEYVHPHMSNDPGSCPAHSARLERTETRYCPLEFAFARASARPLVSTERSPFSSVFGQDSLAHIPFPAPHPPLRLFEPKMQMAAVIATAMAAPSALRSAAKDIPRDRLAKLGPRASLFVAAGVSSTLLRPVSAQGDFVNAVCMCARASE